MEKHRFPLEGINSFRRTFGLKELSLDEYLLNISEEIDKHFDSEIKSQRYSPEDICKINNIFTPTTKTYIIYGCGSKFFKIGKSIDPKKRLEQIRTGNPTTSMVAICERDIEDVLHSTYNKNRVSREWFKFSQDELNTIIKAYGFKLNII